MKKYIVTTSIFSPSKATIAFAEKKDWKLIVVGDKKTPHKEYEKINCIYLAPSDQEKIHKELSDTIGWNCIQRRIFGFIVAYNKGAEVMASVDDDNIPYDNWGEDLLIGQNITVNMWHAENGYFDPLSVTNRNDLWHRGYPLSLVPSKNNIRYMGKENRKVLIQAGLWDGDPDIDAVCRITKKPCVKFNIEEPFASKQLSPFNCQNTFIHRDVIPYYMMCPNIGRMDDIWASYKVLKKFPNSLIYTKASVFQERNQHDYIKDMELEMLGYKHTLNFIEGNYSLPKNAQKAYNLYRKYFQQKLINTNKLCAEELLGTI